MVPGLGDVVGLPHGVGLAEFVDSVDAEAWHGLERVRVDRMGDPRRGQAVTLPALAPWALMNTSADAPSHRVQA